MKLKTYDDWRDAGYQVKKGERAAQRDTKNRPVFSREQVEERNDFDRKEPA